MFIAKNIQLMPKVTANIYCQKHFLPQTFIAETCECCERSEGETFELCDRNDDNIETDLGGNKVL